MKHKIPAQQEVFRTPVKFIKKRFEGTTMILDEKAASKQFFNNGNEK